MLVVYGLYRITNRCFLETEEKRKYVARPVPNPGPLAIESDALPTAPSGPGFDPVSVNALKAGNENTEIGTNCCFKHMHYISSRCPYRECCM